MNPKRHPVEKLDQISKIPPDEVLTFFSQVPVRNAIEALAPIELRGGFTDKKEIIRRKSKLLLDTLGSDKQKDKAKAANVVGRIWLEWVTTREPLNRLLEKFDNSADFADGEKTPNSELDVRCFEFLLEHATNEGLSRDVVREFYRFGYFLPDAKIDALLKTFPEQVPAEVPLKLAAVVNGPSNSISDIDLHRAGNRRASGESNSTAALKENLNALRADLKSNITDLRKLSISLDNEKGRIKKLETTTGSFKQELKGLEARLAEQLRQVESQIASAELEIKRVSSSFEKFTKSAAILEKRVSDLAAKITGASPKSQKGGSQQSGGLVLVEDRVEGKVVDVASIDSLIEILDNNLHSCGLIAGASQVLARGIVAAVIAGQVPVFAGSYSSKISSAAAAAFSAGAVYYIHVRTGILDSREFGSALRDFCNSKTANVLVVKGLNRSAVESYAAELTEIIHLQLRSEADRILPKAIFATLERGPGTLGLYPAITELGPVFDLDCLSWNSQPDGPGRAVGGLSSKLSLELITLRPSLSGHDEQVDNLRKAVDPINSVVWRDILRSANWSLETLPKAQGELAIAGSLLFGWLIPRGIALGVDPAEMASVIKEQFGPMALEDVRIRKLVNSSRVGWF